MKKPLQYSQRVKKLFSALKKGTEKPKKVSYDDIIEAMIFAALCEECTESAAKSAMRKIQSHFVDFNDLRVARTEEIAGIIGGDISIAENKSAKITSLLNAVFQKYDSLITENLIGTGKKGTREILEKLSGMTPFVRNFVYLTALNGHAVPLTSKMIQYLKTYNLVDEQWDDDQIESFIEKQVSASEAYTFYTIIRHDSELANPKAGQILPNDKKATKTKP
ncbi:MAG: Endonuclease III [Planctomycetes bacterium ADurb.Bin401]|nr:MAG: Endonuclease III [Planctomycetes bacterium ADurb.Bin401]